VVDSIALSKSMGFSGGSGQPKTAVTRAEVRASVLVGVWQAASLTTGENNFLSLAIATGWRCRVKDYPHPSCSGHCRKGDFAA
jgi:hypothetical protein